MRNRKHSPDELKRHGWWDHAPFDYAFNAHGFRSHEFDPRDQGIMYLGCSVTLGEALPVELTWPRLVSEALGRPCWNLGQSGAAADTCFRLALHWIPRLEPTAVVLLEPPPDRLELIDPNGIPRLYSHQGFSPGAREWLAHPENGRLSGLKNVGALRDICHARSMPFHTWAFNHLYRLRSSLQSLARDLAHPGKTAHAAFAQTVLAAMARP